jgi:predicted unusual protein kinase regulating ubiquinone biosynthesis (AarF/ABC1/UbiB family)
MTLYDDENSLTGRLKRYTTVSTQLGGQAMGFFLSKLFQGETDHDAQSVMLTQILGNLKGPLMKIAQILGTIPDAVPAEYALQFMALQSNAPPMGWPFVRRRMRTELGEAWENHFASFDREASAAASLGQVHRAVGPKGDVWACKLQYPDMGSVVEADLSQLGLLLKIYEKSWGGLQTQNIFEEIRDRLREELDYQKEAQHMRQYREIFKDIPFIQVPQPIDPLCTQRLLTMTWLEGKPIQHILDRDQSFRNQVAQNLFTAWYWPFYRHGIIHGDPHLGNYSITDEGGVNLLDFGCMRTFPPTFIEGSLLLYWALRKNNKDAAAQAYALWGFDDLSHDKISVLNQWAHLLYGPLLEDRIRPLQENFSGVQGRQTADRVHQELRRLGGIKPPRTFVFMDRAAVGVGSVCLHLKAELNWCQLFQEIVGPERLAHIEAQVS